MGTFTQGKRGVNIMGIMINNIFWDWSGVVKNALDAVHETINQIFEAHGVQHISLDEFRREWRQPYMDFYKKYALKLNEEQQAEEYKQTLLMVTKSFPAGICKGMGELLRRCREEGKQSIVISSDVREHLLQEIEEWGLQGIFTEIYTGVHDKRDGLRERLVKHNCKVEETIFVGDTTHEIESGKSVGIKTVAVTWGFCYEEKLAAAHPDFIAHDSKELEAIIFG